MSREGAEGGAEGHRCLATKAGVRVRLGALRVGLRLCRASFSVEACLVLAPHPAPCEEMKGGCAGMPPSLWLALGLVDPTGGVREPMASVSSRGCRVE